MSKYRRQVLKASCAVVGVFFLAYIIITLIQFWLRFSFLSQPIILAFATLLTLPLTNAFVWERLRGVKVFNVELNFAEVTTPLSVTLTNELKETMMQWELGMTSTPYISEKIKAAIRQEQTAELVEVNLGDGTIWWSTKLYLLAALAEDYTNIRQLVFLENCDGRERCFIGIATPTATRRALAIQHPALEKAYRVAYQQSHDVPIGQTNTFEAEAERVVEGLTWDPQKDKPEGVKILEAAGGERTMIHLVTGQLLRLSLIHI